jgi:signal transduction histidine kinase/ligand-binding sensor domain-containing protein
MTSDLIPRYHALQKNRRELRALYMQLMCYRGVAAKRALILALTFALWAMQISAEAYLKRRWQMVDGLPSDVVQCFAETSDHALWIGTLRGLARFDGTEFRYFTRENTPALAADSVFNLYTAPGGTLWIGTEGGGLVSYKDGQFHRYTEADGLMNDVVRAMLQDAHGSLWIGTDAGLYRMVRNRIQRMDGVNGIPKMSVHALMLDRAGQVWAGGTSLIRIADGVGHPVALQGRTGDSVRIKAIFQTANGELFVGEVSGLFQLRNGQFVRMAGIDRTVRSLYETRNHTLWIGTIGGGLYEQRLESEWHPTKETTASGTILKLFEDSEGNLWVGTQTGMERWSRSALSIIPFQDVSDADFGSVFVDHDESIWFCSSHLYREKDSNLERTFLPGVGNATVRNLLRASDHSLWVGTEGDGVFRIAGSVRAHYTTRQQLANDFVRVMMEDRDGTVWIGSDGGLNSISRNGVQGYDLNRFGLSVMALIQDHEGDILVGTFSGLRDIHQGHWITTSLTTALQGTTIWALFEDRKGTIWVGTDRGLYWCRGDQIGTATQDNGLPSRLIYQIIQDPEGGIWLSGPNEVAHLTVEDLDNIVSGVTYRLVPFVYPVSQDLNSAELYGTIQPAGLLSKKAGLLYPSDKGLVRIDTHFQSVPPHFELFTESIVIDGQESSPRNPLKLGPYASRIEIGFAPALLGPHEGVRFKYRLEGLERDWQDAAGKHSAVYTNLPPGQFTFRLEAFDPGSSTPLAELRFPVVKLAPFYQTQWFLLLIAFLVASIIVGLHLVRLNRVRLQFAAVLAERTRLAREMHDTLIQGCSTVSALMEASASVAGDPTAAAELGELARQQIRSTVREARQAIASLRDPSMGKGDLAEALQELTIVASREFPHRVRFDVAGKRPEVSPELVHQLSMITREALHNALIHAQASEIDVQLAANDTGFIITVKDDGCGICPEPLQSIGNGHFGLEGMRERAQSIGAEFAIVNSGAGTLVSVAVPTSNKSILRGKGLLWRRRPRSG